MINATLDTVSKLKNALVAAEVFVSALPKDEPFLNFEQRLTIISMFSPLKKAKDVFTQFP